jgi:hypothetical protein
MALTVRRAIEREAARQTAVERKDAARSCLGG